MKILCTGGTSFVGAPLVRQLIEDGDEVRVLSRSKHWPRRLKGVSYDHYEGDIRDQHAVARAAVGCDSVIHLAYAPVRAPAREILDTAARGMSSVLRACELYGIRDMLLVSSPRAQDPGDLYGIGKQVQEQMAEAWLRSGTFRRVVNARVYNVYGPDMGIDHVIPQFISRMLALKRMHRKEPVIPFPVGGSGRDGRSCLWTDDCTRQLITLFRHGSPGFSTYDVGDMSTECAIGDLAHLIADCLGCTIEVKPGAPNAKVTARFPELSLLLTELPRRDLASGLLETVEWYAENEEVFCGG